MWRRRVLDDRFRTELDIQCCYTVRERERGGWSDLQVHTPQRLDTLYPPPQTLS